MRRENLFLAVALVALAVVSGTLFADDFGAPVSTATNPNISGAVQSVDVTNGNILLKDPHGNTQTVQTGSTSTITDGGVETKVDNVKPGDRVTVHDGTPVQQQ